MKKYLTKTHCKRSAMIDNLCSRCLLIAEKREQYRINADIAMAAINDSQLG